MKWLVRWIAMLYIAQALIGAGIGVYIGTTYGPERLSNIWSEFDG